jgi:6-phosphofructokinase
MCNKSLFFSYNFKDKDIVSQFYTLLKSYTDIDIYFFDKALHKNGWVDEIKTRIKSCNYFLIFMGEKLGETQQGEIDYFKTIKEEERPQCIKIQLEDYNSEEFSFRATGNIISWEAKNNITTGVYESVKTLVNNYLHLTFDFGDDLPLNPHLFDYEKRIIDFYIRKEALSQQRISFESITEEEMDGIFKSVNFPEKLIRDLSHQDKKIKLEALSDEIHRKLTEGCPPEWPNLQAKNKNTSPNELEDIGDFRSDDAFVLAAALSNYHKSPQSFCMMQKKLNFPEAGPREKLYYPKFSRGSGNTFRVAVLVSGGIAPGINAVIDGISQRHYKYKKENERLEIWGLKKGFQAFENLEANRIYLLNDESSSNSNKKPDIVTSDYINEGGSILGTSRDEHLLSIEKRKDLLQSIAHQLKTSHIRILYIIGGDGSMKAAHAISHVARELETKDWDLSVVAIPKTMDNDILWVWQTFGFLSAVEKAREFIDNLAVEIKSNPRLGIVQLFGSDSGFVVSHAVLASRTGICDFALIPEVPFSMKVLREFLKNKLESNERDYSLIVMAETAIPTDAMDYIDYPDQAPVYMNEKFYIKLKEQLPKESFSIIENHYKQSSSNGNYMLNTSIEEDIKDRIKGILHESGLLKYTDLFEMDFSNDIDLANSFSTEEKEELDNFSEGESKKKYRNILNSIGYYHYIDIDLSKNEKTAIIEYIKLRNRHKRIEGQTNDALRTAGLKIVSKGIEEPKEDWNEGFRVLKNEPRHLLRAIPPSTIDIIFGNRLGTLAVDNAMAGYSDFMISQWLTEFVLVPLKLVVLGRKRIPGNGVFWKSVLAKTGQPANMV